MMPPAPPQGNMDTTLPLHGSVDKSGKRARNYWRLLCYFLHAILVALHLVLLTISTSSHAERRITFPFDHEVFALGLGIGLQAFYTLYTALLVFVTQSLVLSTAFSSQKKLTHIHDICGAWGGLGAALSTLWSQTKVAPSVLSIALVTVYFACVSVLHVASSTVIQLQPFNDTVTAMVPAVAIFPDPSVNLSAVNWRVVTTLTPFLQSFYSNATHGLANNTVHDIPTQSFVNARVNTTTLNAHCGVLTNLSTDGLPPNTRINVSMSGVDPFSVYVVEMPMPNEIRLIDTGIITDTCYAYENCTNLIHYLVSTALEIDDSTDGISPVYLNGTYLLPGGTPQNLTTPVYVVACSLDAKAYVATLDSFENQLDLPEQPTDVAWSTFSPGGDVKLTSEISYALGIANSLPASSYCQPTMSDQYFSLWSNLTASDVYMRSILGMDLSSCSGASVAQYTTPFLLSRSRMESAVSQIATEFIWLAGELGNTGNGFDRRTEESQVTQILLRWRLNINLLPVIAALCASVILCALVVCMLWDHNTPQAAVSAAGVMEIMWLGSRSQVLRDYMRDTQNPSVDGLRTSSMFEITFWTRSARSYVNKESGCFYAAIPLHDVASDASGSRILGSLESTSGDFQSSGLYQREPLHAPDTSRIRRWCYLLHTALVALHIILLALLIRHPEHSVVIPIESNTMTVGLSALLQAIYTLYSVLLVAIMQRLVLFKIVCERRKLTTVHDVSGAWTGIGAAIHVLWQQRQVPSSVWEITAAVTYLTSMSILHIGSSSIMQWQAFNSTVVDVLPSNLALPGSAVDISQLGWPEILSVAQIVVQDAGLATSGLANSTLYDLPQVPIGVTFSEASVNATTLDVKCGLVPNLTLSYQNSTGKYQINFSLNGTDNGTFLEFPIWKDVVKSIPSAKCTACSQTTFYMITTGIDVDESVRDVVTAHLNWTYIPVTGVGYGDPIIFPTLTSIAACTVDPRTVQTTLNLGENRLTSNTDQVASSGSTSWSAWSPGSTTDLGVKMTNALADVSPTTGVTSVSNYSHFSYIDYYIMSFFGLDPSLAFSAAQSNANPSTVLTPSQLENAISQTAARLLWLAGQLGESVGGFERAVGESGATRTALQWRLNLNTVPVLIASMASFTALILVPFLIGKRRTREHSPMISGTSVLECLWLEAHSEALHSRLKAVKEPRSDRLRAAGMFDITLGDIGRPILVPESVAGG